LGRNIPWAILFQMDSRSLEHLAQYDAAISDGEKLGKIGVVDAGGGYRGIYAAGVLDYCIDHKIQFDLGSSVSAGSANLISYTAGQARRNYHFYAEYGLRKEYAGFKNFLFKRSFVDLDYVYGTLSNSDGENPLDYAAAVKSPMESFAVATEAVSGDAKYFDMSYIISERLQCNEGVQRHSVYLSSIPGRRYVLLRWGAGGPRSHRKGVSDGVR